MNLRYALPLLLTGTLVLAQDKPASSAAKPVTQASKPVIEPYPDLKTVGDAMKKAASFFRTHLSFAGGYATKWSRDLKESRDSDRASATLIAIEHPGTPSIGLAMIKAYEATGDKLYLQAAREVEQALLWTQLASGGWPTDHDYALPVAHKRHYRRDMDAGDIERGGRGSHTTLDDDKTQTAALFLLELAQLPESKNDEPLQAALKYALDALLSAQLPNGGWPQGFSEPADKTAPVKKPTLPKEWPRKWPELDYTPYATLNDGNLYSLTELFVRAHEVTGEQRYMDALKKLGDFHILAQCPAPQTGWAQQYNREMEPAWARKFEPPCVSGHESLWAMRTLHEIWLATNDDKYMSPIASGLKWLESSKLPDGQYARFYELHTNKPLYFVKDTYELTYDDSNMPTHYGFKSDELQKDIDQFKELIALPREEQLAKRALPTTERSWLSKAKGAAKKVVTALEGQNKEGVWTTNNVIEAGLFVKHMQAMTNYYEAARKAGAEFEAFRAKGK